MQALSTASCGPRTKEKKKFITKDHKWHGFIYSLCGGGAVMLSSAGDGVSGTAGGLQGLGSAMVSSAGDWIQGLIL